MLGIMTIVTRSWPWAPESVDGKENGYKQQVHTLMCNYTTRIFDADVKAYKDENPDILIEEVHKFLDMTFSEKHIWSAQYVQFSNTYK